MTTMERIRRAERLAEIHTEDELLARRLTAIQRGDRDEKLCCEIAARMVVEARR